MAKQPSLPGPENADDFAQVPPSELFPTNNIRFVISETAKLIERTDNLSRVVDKLAVASDRSNERLFAEISRSTEKNSAALKEAMAAQLVALNEGLDRTAKDLRERIENLKEPISETKEYGKELRTDVDDLKGTVAFVKGVSWVFGGLFVLVLALLTALARRWIG